MWNLHQKFFSEEALDYQLKYDLGIAAATDELVVTNKILTNFVTHKNLKSPQIILTVESSVKGQWYKPALMKNTVK